MESTLTYKGVSLGFLKAHTHTLRYEKPKVPVMDARKEKEKKKRKIIWFNPPYNEGIKTNLGKRFLQLVSKHFPRNHPLYSIINRNTIKLSYSCTKNIRATIQSHNKKVMQPKMTPTETRTCDCQRSRKPQCPLNGECIQTDVIYHVTTPEDPPPQCT